MISQGRGMQCVQANAVFATVVASQSVRMAVHADLHLEIPPINRPFIVDSADAITWRSDIFHTLLTRRLCSPLAMQR